MKNFFLIVLVLLFSACNSNKKFSDFDYSYSRSGGYAPIYENLLIKGNTVNYSFEGQGKNIKKSFKISSQDLQKIEAALTENNFRTIQEDYKKVYDNVSIAINVKKGDNSGSKSDASFIMKKDQKRWKSIVAVFHEIINTQGNLATTE